MRSTNHPSLPQDKLQWNTYQIKYTHMHTLSEWEQELGKNTHTHTQNPKAEMQTKKKTWE